MEPTLAQMIGPEIQALVQGLRKDITSSVLATTSGLNYYYLEEIARNIYPVFYPVLASIPRAVPMQRGVKVGGTGINYKGIVAVDSGGYPGITEGNRNSYLSITERDFACAYKWLGKDSGVTFQAEQTAIGLDDPQGIAQLSCLNALLNDQERMLLWGNSGANGVGNPMGNGFALGQTNTPSVVLASGGAITSARYAKFACIELTGWGIQLATATGVTPKLHRTTANGVAEDVYGGTAQISALSAESAAPTNSGAGNQAFTATVVPKPGALGWAWYMSIATTGAETAATCYFVGITSVPKITVLANPVATNQAADGTQTAKAAVDLATDYSYSALDYDGIMSWVAGAQGGTQKPYLKNLLGATLTPNGDGTIQEIEDLIYYLWSNFKISVDHLTCSSDMIGPITAGILNGGTTGSQRIVFESNGLGTVIGGSLTVEYRSKFSVGGAAKALTVKVHPWLPGGIILGWTVNNPYPAAGGTIPSVLRVVTLEDHFAIRYPITTLQYSMGVYCFETLQNYIPFAHGYICGASPS